MNIYFLNSFEEPTATWISRWKVETIATNEEKETDPSWNFPSFAMSEELIGLFQDIGLSEAKAKETCKNVNLSKILESIIRYSKSKGSADLKPVGLLFYHIASKIKPQIHHHLNKLADYVRNYFI